MVLKQRKKKNAATPVVRRWGGGAGGIDDDTKRDGNSFRKSSRISQKISSTVLRPVVFATTNIKVNLKSIYFLFVDISVSNK